MALTEMVIMPGADYQAIVDSVRAKTGGTEPLKSGDVASEIDGIEIGGIDTSDATATAADMAQGVTAYVNGEKIKGTAAQFVNAGGNVVYGNNQIGVGYTPNDNFFMKKGESIGLVSDASAFGDATAEDVAAGKMFTSTAGLKVTGTMESVEQATPSISIDSDGLITASATQSAGKVAAGTKSATKQLTTKGATNILPGVYSAYVDSGTYLTGKLTIKGDANLVPENIKEGVSIFDVVGTLQGGSNLAVKTGTTTSNVIETGLSSVEHFIIFKTSVTGTGMVFGVYRGDMGVAGYVSGIYCSSYSSYLKSYAFTNGAIGVSKSGGTVTWEPSNANYGLTSGAEYTWYAFGTE